MEKIPNDVKEKIEVKYPAPPKDKEYMYTNKYLFKREGAEFGYYLSQTEIESLRKQNEELKNRLPRQQAKMKMIEERDQQISELQKEVERLKENLSYYEKHFKNMFDER
jgi:predicted RNase H-like nuclease (RuvC/YqgF family)